MNTVNKEIKKSYGDGYIDGFNDARKVGIEGIKAKMEMFNYGNAIKCVEHYLCPMCENRHSKDGICDDCALKASHYTYDENWL